MAAIGHSNGLISLTDCGCRLIRIQRCTCQTSYHHRHWVLLTSLSSQALYRSRLGFSDSATWGLALSTLCYSLVMMSPSGIERLPRSLYQQYASLCTSAVTVTTMP